MSPFLTLRGDDVDGWIVRWDDESWSYDTAADALAAFQESCPEIEWWEEDGGWMAENPAYGAQP